MRLTYLYVVVFSSYFSRDVNAQNICHPHSSSPVDCMRTQACSFCVQAPFSSPRCDVASNLIQNGCTVYNICDPEGNTIIETTPEEPDPCGEDPVAPVIPVCPGMKRNITITFKLQEHPVDVYLLMDFSGSMGPNKANVVKLSAELLERIRQMSPDHRVGFGTFVDKPITPFGNPLYGDYSFRNDFPLTDNLDDFADRIAAIPILHGASGPESQLDGLFESAVCSEEIGWRSYTRHILVLTTDAPYHYAEQGLPLGLTPFDGKCSLDSTGLYFQQLIFDYPSDDQIVEILTAKQITPIFAVVPSAQYAYQHYLTKIVPSAIGILSTDSSNVVDIIAEEYQKIASRVEIEQDGSSTNFGITFYSNCNGEDDVATPVCEGINPDEDVTFTIQVEPLDCPGLGDLIEPLKINPKGLPTFAEVALKLICQTEW